MLMAYEVTKDLTTEPVDLETPLERMTGEKLDLSHPGGIPEFLGKRDLVPGRRNEIVTSHTVDRLPLLSKDQDTVVGRTYQDAECRFDLRATGQADGRVRLSLVPELHHGQPRVLWAGSEGVLRSYTGKPKRTFDEWKLELSLSAGQMLLLAAAPHRPGTLGHHFFTEPIADDVVHAFHHRTQLAQRTRTGTNICHGLYDAQTSARTAHRRGSKPRR